MIWQRYLNFAKSKELSDFKLKSDSSFVFSKKAAQKAFLPSPLLFAFATPISCIPILFSNYCPMWHQQTAPCFFRVHFQGDGRHEPDTMYLWWLQHGRETGHARTPLPTQALVRPYNETNGGEAVELYEHGGRAAMDWQKALRYDNDGHRR